MIADTQSGDPDSERHQTEESDWVATRPTPEFLAALGEGVDKAVRTAGPDFGKALGDLEKAVQRVPPFDLICFIGHPAEASKS